MALDSYAGLLAALGAWATNRSDLPAADLVALAEARLNRDLRLRRMEAETALTLAAGARTAPLPGDFLEPLALWAEEGSGRRALRFVLSSGLAVTTTAGAPGPWSVDGDALVFGQPADQDRALTLRYLQRLDLAGTAPADGTQVNWLLLHWPDAYLAAGNVEAALWLQDDEQAVRWQARYADTATAISRTEARSGAMTTLGTDAGLLRRGSRWAT